jgi:hypothetical protein
MQIIDNTHTTVELRRESHYGSTFYYVVDEYLNQHIKTLTGRKSITDSDMLSLQALGFTFRLQSEPLPSWSA